MSDEEQQASINLMKEGALRILWCPGCNKMLSNEYNRCPQCKAIVNEDWLAEYEVVQKLEKELDELIDTGYYERARVRSEILRDIGIKLNDKLLIEEQDALIAQLGMELGDAEEYEQIVENCRKVILIFDKFTEIGRFVEAHELVKEFKRVHERQLRDVQNFPIIEELLDKDKKLFVHLVEQQKDIENRLQVLEEQIIIDIANKNFTSADVKWKEAKELVNQLIQQEIIKKWENFEYEYLDFKQKSEEQAKVIAQIEDLKAQIEKDANEAKLFVVDIKLSAMKTLVSELIDVDLKKKYQQFEKEIKQQQKTEEKGDKDVSSSDELPKLRMQIISDMNRKDFKSADEKWLKAAELLRNIKLEALREKWFNFKEIYEERKKKSREEEHAKKKEIRKLRNQLSEAEDIFKDCIAQYLLHGARFYAKKIINIAEKLNEPEIAHNYKMQIKHVAGEMAERDVEKQDEILKHSESAKALEPFFESDSNVLPLVAEILAEELLEGVETSIDKVMGQLISTLDNYRVDLKTELVSHQFLTSKSEEFLEHEQMILIEEPENKSKKSDIELTLDSFLINPFESELDEAIVLDILPYNYEILEVRINDLKVNQQLNMNLTIDGLEVKWVLKNVPSEQKVIISYKLRKRASRTIIFIHQDTLKIIKTHSSLKWNDKEEYYEATLALKNPYDKPIERIIIEDILPLYHLDSVIEPKRLTPMIMSYPNLGDVARWSIPSFKVDKQPFIYKLT